MRMDISNCPIRHITWTLDANDALRFLATQRSFVSPTSHEAANKSWLSLFKNSPQSLLHSVQKGGSFPKAHSPAPTSESRNARAEMALFSHKSGGCGA
jgi:hypothetical protein